MGRLSSFAAKAARNAAKEAEERAVATAEKDTEKAAVKAAKSFAAKPKVKALPAPQKPLALPKPGPGLPSFAVKPKGGQWWADKYIGAVRPSDLGVKVGRLPDDGRWFAKDGEGRLMLFDTEDQARSMSQNWVDSFNKNASVERAVRRIADNRLGLVSDANGPLSQLQSWFLRAAPRYIKNEMGTAEDPMRALAERGALHVAMSPDEWSQAAGDVIKGDTIGDVLGLNQLYPKEGAMPGAGDDFRASVVTNMPWLTKAPVTDQVYRIGDTHTLEDKMGLAHILDEMRNAMHERSDLPPDLAVRPESLGRMGLAQAAERVGLINQWRAKQAEQAALSAMDSPAIHTFKEYAENNPMGLRWVELKAPKDAQDTSKFDISYDPTEEGYVVVDPAGRVAGVKPTQDLAEELAAQTADYNLLEDALRYEGDTMGHCVGGYCDDVLGGRSRIFSLRDAKGEPHVTIETSPGQQRTALADIPRDALDQITAAARADTDQVAGPMGISPDDPRWVRTYQTNLALKQREWLGANPQPDSIVQIKGKQNRAPKDDYLPFVQDFVKSGKWGNVGDLENTGLTRLPDGRYITAQQMTEGMTRARAELPPHVDPSSMLTFNWEGLSPYFEGYAIGGRVAADRCFCRHPMSVKRAA